MVREILQALPGAVEIGLFGRGTKNIRGLKKEIATRQASNPQFEAQREAYRLTGAFCYMENWMLRTILVAEAFLICMAMDRMDRGGIIAIGAIALDQGVAWIRQWWSIGRILKVTNKPI